jgi:multidrug efflux system membrane fusion protein
MLLAGCSSSSTDVGADGGGKGKGKGKGGGGAAQPVVVATALRRDVPIEIAGLVGPVEAYKTISLRSQITGQLTQIYFNEGDYVKAGDKLFSVDPRLYDAQLQQARANLARSKALLEQAKSNVDRDLAQQNYLEQSAQRQAQLFAQSIASRDQADQAAANAKAQKQLVEADRAAVESAAAQINADQAHIDNLTVQLGYATITSPIDGRTGNVTVKVGNIVSANTQEVVTINQVEPIYVTFAVPEARLPEIRRYSAAGTLAVTVRSQDDGSPGSQGKLTFIDNAVDTTTGTIKLKATFENKDHKLWPGQFLNVVLHLTTQPNAITVPNEAVQNGQDGQFIYVVKADRTVEARPVTVGSRVDQDLVITQGIEAGETVVTQGQLRLQPGSPVQPTGADGKGGGRGKGNNPDTSGAVKGRSG